MPLRAVCVGGLILQQHLSQLDLSSSYVERSPPELEMNKAAMLISTHPSRYLCFVMEGKKWQEVFMPGTTYVTNVSLRSVRVSVCVSILNGWDDPDDVQQHQVGAQSTYRVLIAHFYVALFVDLQSETESLLATLYIPMVSTL